MNTTGHLRHKMGHFVACIIGRHAGVMHMKRSNICRVATGQERTTTAAQQAARAFQTKKTRKPALSRENNLDYIMVATANHAPGQRLLQRSEASHGPLSKELAGSQFAYDVYESLSISSNKTVGQRIGAQKFR